MNATRTSSASRPLLAGALLLLVAFASCGGESPGDTPSTHQAQSNEARTAAHSHDTSGETCSICDASKRETGRLWCTEHARYEDRCWECQPQLREEGRLYCEEHSLYEDECFLCHPELEDAHDDENSMLHQHDSPASALFCREHQVPENECGICQPQLAAALEPGAELKVRFESEASATKAGVGTVPALATDAQVHVAAVFETSYNENALAHITPLAAGIVGRVLVDVGDDVEVGQILVELQSPDVAAAKSAFVISYVDLALKKKALVREQDLATKSISSEKELQEAEAAHTVSSLALATARQQLRNFGFTEAELDSISTGQDTSATLPIRAPFRGTLVERDAVLGEAVEPGVALFVLADLDEMWLDLAVPADKAGGLELGAAVVASLDSSTGAPLRGALSWIGTAVDTRSRMLKARAVVDNRARTVRAGSFGDARILVGEPTASVSVPRESVQRYESNPYVFLRLEDDLYSLRRVETVGALPGNRVAVVSGLQPNEEVVATGAFTVMSEFLKSRLGAGCVDD